MPFISVNDTFAHDIFEQLKYSCNACANTYVASTINCNLLSQLISFNCWLIHVDDVFKLQLKWCSQNSLNHGFLDDIVFEFLLLFKSLIFFSFGKSGFNALKYLSKPAGWFDINSSVNAPIAISSVSPFITTDDSLP